MQKANIRATITTAVVALFPVLLWVVSQPILLDTLSSSVNTAAKLFALAGFSLFGWNIILSTRLEMFERLYGGLPNLYRWHHRTGCIAFMLLIIHPTLIAIRYAMISFTSAYEFLKPSLNYPQLAAEATLGIMFVAIFATTYSAIKHELFVKLQITLGLVFFLGAYHAIYMTGSDVLQSWPLVIYGSVLVGLALIVMLYRSLFHGSFRRRYSYQVTDISKQAEVLELSLSSNNGIGGYTPGQFVFVKPINSAVKKQFHPFSLTSVPGGSTISVGIKQLGDFTNSLTELKVGDDVIVEGAYGEFGSELTNYQKQIWIAGGIGITPFVAMAKSLDKQQIDLFYSVRTKSQAYFLRELQASAKLKPNFHIHLIDTEHQPQLTSQDVIKLYDDDTAVWICGPPPMMKALKRSLVKDGVSKSHIITEEFSLS